MNSNQAYESFIIKTNKNAQTDNMSVDKGRFVKLFNEASNKFVEWVLEKKNEDDIRYLQPILKTKIEKSSVIKPNYQLFKLPTNFFDLGDVSGKASSECCKDVVYELFEIKVDNSEVIINNELIQPSSEYREAPYYLQSKNIKIFTDNFKVNSVEITYYKYPQYIELINEDNPESEFKNSEEVLEFDDKVLDRIISIAVADNSQNTGSQKVQLDKMRVSNKF